jgi:tripartite-type tricarboxylate transporter receptor subunit TctC
MRSVVAIAVSLLLVFAGTAPARAAQAAAQPDTAFYRGKTMTWIVATGPGGGYDSYSRLIARHMQKYLPGVRIIVRNVPGAGHIVGANTLYAARPDGLTVGMFNTGLIYNQLLQRPGVRFDLGKMSWIGSSAHDIRVLVISKRSGFANFKQMQDHRGPLKFAAAGVGSAAYNDTRISARALGLDVEIVSGYEGQEGELSMLRGDVVAQVGAASAFENFVRNGGGYYGLVISGTSRVLPGVPLARDYGRDERGRRLLGLIEALSELGRLTAGPAGIPPARLAALRQAHDRAVQDPAFLAEARQVNLPIDLTSGAEVEAKVRHALAQPPDAVALLREATSVE